MKTIDECKEILGARLVVKVEHTLKSKGIDEHTINRILDYLALHKLSFPYINIEEHARNLCDNMKKSIDIKNLKEATKGLFKTKAYGMAGSGSIILNVKPIKFILPSKQYNTMLNALIRHELDHIATDHKVELNREQFKEHLAQNILKSKKMFGVNYFTSLDEARNFIEKSVKNRFRAYKIVDEHEEENSEIDKLSLSQSGISGFRYIGYIENLIGSNAFNEGITAYKMKVMDKMAGESGAMCQSGYILGEETARHFAEVIGEEELVKMQIRGNFFGIVERYKEKTGKSAKEMNELFDTLESGGRYKSAFHKLFAQLRYALKNEMNQDTKSRLLKITNIGESELE